MKNKYSLVRVRASRRRFIPGILATAIAMALAMKPAQAASGSWNVDAAGNWSTAASWNPAVVPGTAEGDVINLQFDLTAARTVTINSVSVTAGDLNIGDATAPAFGYTLARTGTLVLNLNNTGTTAANIDFTADAANTISAPITLVDNGIIRSNVASSQTLSGIISGASKTLTFNNDTNGTANAAGTNLGQFTLSGANTYTGGTSISDVRVATGVAAGFGTGAISVTGAGQVFLTADVTIANAITLNSTNWNESSGTFGALRLDNGTVSGAITLARNTSIGSNNSNRNTISGAIAGAANLTKLQGGLIVLTGNNTYTGMTIVNNGVLRLGAVNAINGSYAVVVENPANNAASDTNALQLSGGFSYGAGKTLTLRNNATANIANARVALENQAGNNTWAGNIIIDGGANQAITSSAGVLTIDGNISQSAIPSTQLFIRGGATGIINGTFNLGTATLAKTDTGTWTINSGGNVQGNVILGNGTLVLNNNNAVLPTAALTLGEGNGNVTRVTINAGFSQGFASIVNAPTTTGAQIIDGAGTLDVGAAGINVTVTDSAVANDLTISSLIGGAGNLTKLGAGNLVLNSTSTAPVVAVAGTVSGTGTLASLNMATGTTLSPGTASTAGTLTVGNLTLADGTLTMNLGSLGNDLIQVTGSATQSGSTAIAVVPNGTLNTASTFYPVIAYTGTTPGTAGFTITGLPPRALASVTDSGTAIGITATNDRVVWTGNTTSTWAVSPDVNWELESTPATDVDFMSLDSVVFNNVGLAWKEVALGGTVDPSAVEFAHTSDTYTMSASTLSGAPGMPLKISGAGGTTVFTMPATFTGPTTISAGTLEIDHDGGSLTGTSGVDIAAGGVFRLTDDDGDIAFNRVLSGAGAVVINPITSSGAAAASRNVTLSGVSPSYTGQITLASPANAGSARLQAGPTVVGGASIVVQNENQFYATSNVSYSNNITITGDGYNDALGSIGALRMDGGVTWNGTTTVTGTAGNSAGTAYDARIASNGGTNTIAGSISGGDVNFWVYNNTQAFIRLTAANSYGDTIIGGADNTVASGVNSVTLGNGEAAPTNTTATLGTGDIYLVAGNNAAPRQAILRINRADGYTLGTGQDIFGVATASAQLVNGAQLLIDTTGTGFTVGANTIDLADGTSGGQIRVAQLSNNSVMNIGTGSTIDTGFLRVGENTGLSGTINQTAGSVNALIDIRVGHFTTNLSTYNFSGGTITLPTTPASEPSAAAEVSGALYVGVDGTGIFNQTNGTLNAAGIVLDNRGDTAGNDQFNLSGGTVELRNSYGIVGRNISATVALNGGTIKNVGTGVDVAINATTITTSGSTTLDTNGATNKFSLMSSITGSGTLTSSGGGVIELEPDINTTKTSVSTGTGTQSISAILAGTSAVTKLGTGTTILSAANTYSGATTVSAGNLGITGSLANSDVTVATAATISGEGSVKSLTFGTGSTTLVADGLTTGALTSTGTLTVNGIVSVDLAAVPSGAVTVLTHGGTSAASANFTLTNPTNYRNTTFVVGTNDVTIDVNKKTLAWDGTTATWEIAGTQNDWNGGANDNYFDGDDVVFDGTYVTADQAITLGVNVEPSSVTVGGNDWAYSITGTGGILGSTKLVKNGTNTLTLGGANNFTGGIALNAGRLEVATAATQALGGTGSIKILADAQLDLNGVNLDVTRSYSLDIAGDGTDGSGAIRNDTAVINQNSRIINLVLSDDASVGAYGGTLPNGNRFDMALGGTITGNGHTLTKLGDALIGLRGPATDISFDVNAGTLRAEDSDLAFGSTGVFVNGGATIDTWGNRTLAVPVTFADGARLTSSSGTANWNGVMTLEGAVNMGGDANAIINQAFAETGTGLFTKSGLGTLVLPVANTFDRKFNVTGTGILRIAADSSLGVAPSTPSADAITLQQGGRIQGGNGTVGVDLTIDPNRGVTLAGGDGGFHAWTGFTINYAGLITGSGNLAKTDSGVFNYTGTSNHTGTTIANGGTFNLNAATISSTSAVRGLTGTLNVNAGSTVTTTRLITADGDGAKSIVNLNGGTVNVTGAINTDDTAASLLIGHWGANGASSVFNISGGTLNAVGAEMKMGWDTSIASVTQTGGTVNILGVDFANGRNNNASYNLIGGELNLGASGIQGNAAKQLNVGGATIGAFADWTSSQATTLTGVNGNLTVNTLDSVDDTTARTVTWAGAMSGVGGLVKTGAGTLNLNALNSYTGNTVVNEGTLSLNVAGGATGTIRGSLTANTGTLVRFNAGDVTGYDATTRLHTINLVGAEMNIAVITNQTLGRAAINMTGASITGIAGSNLDFFNGDGTTNSRVNSLASATTSTISGTQLSIRQTGGVTFNVEDGTTSSGVDLQVSSVIAINGLFLNQPLIKAGAGTLELAGVNTYNSNTLVNDGTLILADNGRLTFTVTDAANNSISGAGAAELNGDFAINTAATTVAIGSWVLENVTSLTGAYGSSFQVVNPDGSPWTDAGANKWTRVDGAKLWTFDETTGALTVGPNDPFVDWATSYGLTGGDAAKGADPDGDGEANLLEFATNSNPTSGSSRSRVYGKMHGIGADNVLTYTVAVRTAATFAAAGSKQEATKDSVKYSIEASDDLSTWSSVVVTEVTGGDATAVRAAITPALPTLDSGWEWRTFRTDDGAAIDAKDFIRLQVSTTP
jgi:autotransporter-associated beta strand protein